MERHTDHHCEDDAGMILANCVSIQHLQLTLDKYDATAMLNTLPFPHMLRSLHLIFHITFSQFDVQAWFLLRCAVEDAMRSGYNDLRIQIFTLFHEETIVQGYVDVVNSIIDTFIPYPSHIQIDIYGFDSDDKIELCSQFVSF